MTRRAVDMWTTLRRLQVAHISTAPTTILILQSFPIISLRSQKNRAHPVLVICMFRRLSSTRNLQSAGIRCPIKDARGIKVLNEIHAPGVSASESTRSINPAYCFI